MKTPFQDSPRVLMNPAPSVYQSVSLSVRPSVTKNSHTFHHYFFLKHCMKLDHYKCRKVTKPDFPGKLSNFLDQHFWSFKLASGSQSVCPSVCLSQKFSYFPPLVFSDFLQQVSLFQVQKSDGAEFLPSYFIIFCFQTKEKKKINYLE